MRVSIQRVFTEICTAAFRRSSVKRGLVHWLPWYRVEHSGPPVEPHGRLEGLDAARYIPEPDTVSTCGIRERSNTACKSVSFS